MNTLLNRIVRLDANHRLWISLSAGTLAYFLAGEQRLGQTQWVIAYTAYSLTVIGFIYGRVAGSIR